MSDPLVQSLGPDGAARMRPWLATVQLPPGSHLLDEGERSSTLWFLLDGEVSICLLADGAPLEVSRRGPGSWLGEVAFFDHGPSTATVVATTPVVVARIDHAELAALEEADPQALHALLGVLLRQMAERVSQGSSGILEAAGPTVRVRKPAETRSWLRQVLDGLFGGTGA